MKRRPERAGVRRGKDFALQNIEALRQLRIPKCCWVGIYESPQPRWTKLAHRRPLCVGRSGPALARRLEQMERKLPCPLAWPLFAVPVRKRGQLPAERGLPTISHYGRLKQSAYDAVAEARKRGDWGFLRELSKEAQSGGKGRGREMSAATNRQAIRAILEGSKQVAAEEGSAGYEKALKRLSVAVHRFCARVYEDLQGLFPSLSGNAGTQAILGCLHQSEIRSWPGINFRDAGDQAALITAYRWGECIPPKQRARLLARPVSVWKTPPTTGGFAQSAPTYFD